MTGYTYNAANELTQVRVTAGDGTTHTMQYVYDGDGALVLRAGGELTYTFHVGDYYEESCFPYPGEGFWGCYALPRAYFYAAGQAVAARVGSYYRPDPWSSWEYTTTVYYLHHDRLGNPSTDSGQALTEVSDATGALAGRARYDGFGAVLSSTIPATITTRLYTGSIYDPDTGLYRIGARWYDPVTALWLTPDAIVPDINNPIAWNPYAFNYHDPVNYVDPTGHFVESLVDVIGFGMSLRDFWRNPTLGNAFWLALDAASLALPFVTGAWVRHAGKVDEVADVIRYAPRSSGHHPALQRAIVEGLEEGQIVAFRGMEWGWGSWARKGWGIPFKPSDAGRTLWKGPKGLRLTEKGLFITDLDAAWALNRSGMMGVEAFETLQAAINKAYGKEIVLHGHHWQGLRDLAGKVYAIDNGKDYVRATVYVYGKNINGVTGFLGSGPALDMYRKYHSMLVP